jgi:hypothetical protein
MDNRTEVWEQVEKSIRKELASDLLRTLLKPQHFQALQTVIHKSKNNTLVSGPLQDLYDMLTSFRDVK